MTKKPTRVVIKEGHQPIKKGYQPTPVSKPNPQGGHQPSKGQGGSDTGTPPKK